MKYRELRRSRRPVLSSRTYCRSVTTTICTGSEKETLFLFRRPRPGIPNFASCVVEIRFCSRERKAQSGSEPKLASRYAGSVN